MPIFRINAFLPAANAALRSPLAFVNATMLSKAVKTHASAAPKSQNPLRPNAAAANIPRPAESNKRKFDRTMSSTSTLGALHESTAFFNENDFDDDATIDLTGSPSISSKADVQYPSLDRALSEVVYPTLPPTGRSQNVSSSAPIPWSSSPPEHLKKPIIHDPPEVHDAEVRPSKRRTVPWLDKNGNDKTSFTPLPQNKTNGNPYPWNKTASAVKDEQREYKRRNKMRTQSAKPEMTKSSNKGVAMPFLSEEQKHILKAVVEDGKSVFFTGSAGTGKSVLMRSIIGKLRDKFRREPDRIAVTASTGLAACNIEGITLHSFAGIGLGKEPAPELIKKIKRNATFKQRWLRTKVLIIDEISMVDGELFDKLEQIARAIRNNGKPFGGVQLVITGDFFQLPPVPERNQIAKFAFDAATWSTSIEHTILLTHVFRQKDPVFANMLNEMRLGKITPASNAAFRRLSRNLTFTDDIECTELFPTRAEVDYANNSKMKGLSGQDMIFHAQDSGTLEPIQRAKVFGNFMAPEILTLRKGAQVMLIKNIDTQLVNGSTGKIIAFMNENDFTVYKDNEQLYSQAHEPEDVGDEERNEQNKKARAIIQAARFKDGSIPSRAYPMVRFTLADNTSRDLLCQPEEFKTEAPGGEILAKRIQVPLILAWALSIHKAQGQTLERVKVNLGKVFEKGQAYVALSRATSQEGLQVANFDPRKVMVHPKVITFYNNLVSIETALERSGKNGPGTSATDYEQNFVDANDEELSYMYM